MEDCGTSEPRGSGGELTAYLRDFGEEPASVEGVVFAHFWKALVSALRRELRARGLWAGSPRFVGIEGAEEWSREVLEELAVDSYAFLLQRLRSLHQQAKRRTNIDGLVVLNLRHFLYERQKVHDPLGHRVFEIARKAARKAVADGALKVIAGSPRIENSTILEPRGGAAGDRTGTSSESGSAGRLQLLGQRWADGLLPDLVTARGRQREDVVSRLARDLGALDGNEVGTPSFKALVDPLKKAVRVRWQALWVQERGPGNSPQSKPAGGAGTAEMSVVQQLSFEDEESFVYLVRQVSEAIETAPATVQRREYLRQLWVFLRMRSADPGMAEIPSRRKVAELLGIPRYVLPDLYKQLGRLIEGCQEPEASGATELRRGRESR